SLAQPFDNFEEAALFFKSALGLQTHEDIEIPATYGLFRSRAVSNRDRSVRVITTVALLDDDAGVTEDESRKNSVAFEVPDIFEACERVWARGGELLRIGHNYYVDLANRTPRHPVRPDRVGEVAAGLHADDRQPPLLRAVPTDRRIRLVRHRKRAGADLGPPGCDPGPTHQGRRRGLAGGAGDGNRTRVASLEDLGLTNAYQIAHDAEHTLTHAVP